MALDPKKVTPELSYLRAIITKVGLTIADLEYCQISGVWSFKARLEIAKTHSHIYHGIAWAKHKDHPSNFKAWQWVTAESPDMAIRIIWHQLISNNIFIAKANGALTHRIIYSTKNNTFRKVTYHEKH